LDLTTVSALRARVENVPQDRLRSCLVDAFFGGDHGEHFDKYGQEDTAFYDAKQRLLAKAIPYAEERVHYLHVPKTGGGTIEELAREHGHRWGEDQDWPMLDEETMPCVRKNVLDPNHSFHDGFSFHHVPPCFWKMQQRTPWHRLTSSGHTRTTFCTVRHPYGRAVSAFKWRHSQAPTSWYCSTEQLNQYIQDRLTLMLQRSEDIDQCTLDHSLGYDDCHWLPQSMYTPECDHVLRYESLAADLTRYTDSLVASGHLNARFNFTSEKAGDDISVKHSSTCRLDVGHLDNSTRQMLNQVYRRDFDTLGYDHWTVVNSKSRFG